VIILLQDVGFAHREIPIENIEELAFNPSNVASTEHTRTQGPLIILDRPVVDILISKYERPQEDTFTCPLGGLDEEVLLSSLHIR